MRKPVLLIWTNAAILIVLFALMAQSLFLVTRVVHTRWTRGQVQVLRAGQSEWSRVSPGTPIKTGDTISTGFRGRAEFALADGTRWKLEPNTRLVVQRAQLNSWRGDEQTQFRLESGKVWVRVVKRLTKGSSFRIETPSALASVRGTVWSIEVARNQTHVGVFQGFVDVSAPESNSTEPQRVCPGARAVASEGVVHVRAASALDKAAFEEQPDLTRPELSVRVRLSGTWAILSGETEAGDALFVNREPLKVLGNGAFVSRVALRRGFNQWKLTATDLHGQSTSTCHAADFDGKTATPSACQ